MNLPAAAAHCGMTHRNEIDLFHTLNIAPDYESLKTPLRYPKRVVP